MAQTNSTETARCDVDAVFDCLSHRHRRYLLDLLRGRTSMTESDLATHIVAWERAKPLIEVTRRECKETLSTLHHLHLPKLAASGLVERDETDQTVTVTDNPVLQTASVLDAIDTTTTDSHDSLDAVFDVLATERRRTMLSILAGQYHPIKRRTLARDVVAQEADIDEKDVSVDEVDAVLASIHHVHLPKLLDAGFVEYDAEAETVTYEGHPALRVEWVESSMGNEISETVASDEESGDIQTIDGRSNIISYGQSLCEYADDELFLLFTKTGLLEAGCFTRIADAVDRGVDVYLGSPDSQVRERVKERMPGVTIWEPKRDWLNLPSSEGRVGRLVFADREAVMLGTLGELEQGVHQESAIAGRGTNNGLVTLMRELLNPRLGLLEAEGHDIQSPL